MNELRRVKDELYGKLFLGVRATIWAEDFIILHSTNGDGNRARVPYEEALRIIRSAPDEGTMWSTLEAEGLMWPRMERSGDDLDDDENA